MVATLPFIYVAHAAPAPTRVIQRPTPAARRSVPQHKTPPKARPTARHLKGKATSRPVPIRIPADLPVAAQQGFRLTETLLRHLGKQRYQKVLALMNDTIRKVLTPHHLSRQDQMVRSVIGVYQWNTLRLHSKISHKGQTRYIWHGRFVKEKGTILVLFDANNKISGFVIQSPSLLRKLHKEQAAPTMDRVAKGRLEQYVNLLLRGYNLGKWKLFSKPCSLVMKKMMAPPRFQALRKKLLQQYGRYQSRRLVEVRRLSSLPNALIFRYYSKFSKRSKVRLQIVFQKKGQSYQIASWQLR